MTGDAGFGLIVIFSVTVSCPHPYWLCITARMVPDPEFPQSINIELSLGLPRYVPPVIFHSNESPLGGLVAEYKPTDMPWHAGFGPCMFLIPLNAVSYTHLDVYKRQQPAKYLH